MNLRDGLTTLIDFARESGRDDKHLQRAVKVVEKKAERMRLQYERRITAHLCRCGQHRASGIVCWACWAVVPIHIRHVFRASKKTALVRVATRRILEIAKGRAP